MQITVHDTLSVLEPLFTERHHPKDLFKLARPLFYDDDGLLRRLQKQSVTLLYNVMQGGELDGYDAGFGRQAWGLFNPTRKPEVTRWAFERFVELDVLRLLNKQLNALALQIDVPPLIELNVYLMPADPANRTLMLRSHGLSLYAGSPGTLLLQLWPSEGNLQRLRPMLARGLVHTLRQGVSEAETLADCFVLEGLATQFLQEMSPETVQPWLTAFQAPTGWKNDLDHVAKFYDLPNYDALKTNIYGTEESSAPVPQALPLDADELDSAKALILESHSETHPAIVAAHLYGDELVAPQGHPGVGMPAYGGLELSYQLFADDLAPDFSEALIAPTSELLKFVGFGS